jgi:hypothetical protein
MSGMAAAKNKGGRPPLPEGKAKGHMLQVRLSDAERITYQKAAERCGQSLSEWIRERLERAAKREAKEA